MNIAFIHPNYPGSEGSGATHSATQVVRGLRDRGHNIRVYCTKPIPDEMRDNRLVDLDIDRRFPRHFDEELNRAIKDRAAEFEQFDILHTYLMRPMAAVGAIGRERDVATSMTLNAYRAICPKNDLRYMGSSQCESHSLTKCAKCLTAETAERAPRYDEPAVETVVRTPHRWLSKMRSLRQVFNGLEYTDDIDAYRAPSKHVKWNYEKFGFNGDRIRVIPHPVDDDFQVDHSSDFTEPYELLYVGALEDHKGVDRLIPILEELDRRSVADFKLTIVGSGTLHSRIESQASEAGLEASVDIKGFIQYKQLPSLYAESDLFVYPGRWDEPFARVFLESLASGTPIATTDFGDIYGMLGDACVTANGSPSDFARVIEAAVSEGRLEEMSHSATEKSHEYDCENILDDIEQMYQAIV